MIIVCFICFDNSLFWPLYDCIPNAKTFLFSYVRMKKSQFQVGKYQRKNHRFFSSKLCLKLFVYLDSRSDISSRLSAVHYRHISRATTMKILSLHYKGPRVLCPLTIGISAVVYFFASTGNFPCKYNNQLNLFSGCIKR